MVTVADIAADLAQEHAALDAIVDGLTEEGWTTATSSPGWTVADQIGHLTYFDVAANLSITDPERFIKRRERLLSVMNRGDDADAMTLASARASSGIELVESWRRARSRLTQAAAGLAEDARLEWYGPPMGAKSFLSARLMETWAHGQDVIDAIGGYRPATDRLRHVAEIGVRTRAWSYLNRGLPIPESEVSVNLESPSGGAWTWGSEDAEHRIQGPAEDFCLVVTQRRHHQQTNLEATGSLATEWLAYAQAFAGPPTNGPAAPDTSSATSDR